MMLLLVHTCIFSIFIFFFTDTATTEIYTLSLHDALPIWWRCRNNNGAQEETACSLAPRFCEGATPQAVGVALEPVLIRPGRGDRKSTRLNSSHANISYAVFCLKKKKKQQTEHTNS